MSEKHLAESAWKTFSAKTGDYKEAPLAKAMAALAKAEKTGPADELQALDDIDKEVEVLRKAHKQDKPLLAYLDDIDKAAERQRKAAQQAQKEAEKEAEKGGDDEEDSPALLGSKLIPLLRELRKGEAVMPALILLAGKDTAVLVQRRAISPSRGKLLKEYLKASGSVKLVQADCRFENGAHTFVVHGEPASGLAKKLRSALQLQTDLKLKVRVRGEDPNDVDEDGEDGEAVVSSPGPSTSSGTGPQDDHGAQAYEELRRELEPQLATALRERHPEATKLRAVDGFAAQKAEAGDYAGGIKALETLAKLLAAGVTAPKTESPALQTALQDWTKARNAVLLRLREQLLELKQDQAEDPGYRLAFDAEIELGAVMRQLTAEPGTTAQLNDLAAWLNDDSVVDDVDRLLGDIRSPLLAALGHVRQALGTPAP